MNKLAAEERGESDLAAKLERDYKETMREKEKVRESLNRPLERRKRLELVAAAEQRVMVGADVFLSTLSSSLNQVRGVMVGADVFLSSLNQVRGVMVGADVFHPLLQS